MDNEQQRNLDELGYPTIEHWALDQNYRYDKYQDRWYDTTGTPVDLEQALSDNVTDYYHRHLDMLP